MFEKLIYFGLIVIIQADYWTERKQFIRDERQLALGSNIILNSKEEQVNEILMKYKKQELEDGMKTPSKFPPAIHFFEAKELINKSKVFDTIRQMPKGAILHSHDASVVNVEWLVKNVTYRENLYISKMNGTIDFKFANPVPKDKQWRLVSEMRNKNVNSFDNWIRSILTLEVEKPYDVYKDSNDIWKTFLTVFKTRILLLSYRPVYEDYVYEVHTNLYADNVMYFEVRSHFFNLYELNGTLYDLIKTVGITENVSKRFINDHPDFIGMRVIYSSSRTIDNAEMESNLHLYSTLKDLYPNFVVGFDIASQEDMGHPDLYFLPELLKYKDDARFFFHAGETDWNGMYPDIDLIDAILLNTTRIGHGFALLKHPKVLEAVKERNIAIEVNPISNQVLMLIKDLRNHPANYLIANNFPVVISCDDYGLWGSTPLSHDFYVTFMGMANADDDLKLLKQLAINSIKYSAMGSTDKEKARVIWSKSWDIFLENVIKQ